MMIFSATSFSTSCLGAALRRTRNPEVYPEMVFRIPGSRAFARAPE